MAPASEEPTSPDLPRRLEVPRETTPTWEMELLLSGATVFGLVQLPHQLDLIFFEAFARSPEDLAGLALVGWIYAKSAVLLISGTFLLHLGLRGFWIALVGLDSVYPGGIRWDRLRVGPHQRAAGEAAHPPIAARIERADNRATRVFGVGVGITLAVLLPLAVLAVCVLAYALFLLTGIEHRRATEAFWAFFPVLLLPFALLALLDRWLGRRLPEGGAAARLARAIFRWYDRVGLGRGANPLLAIFQSNAGAWRTGLVIFGAIAGIVTAQMVQFAAWQGRLDLGDNAGLPDDGPGAADSAPPEHYASQRGTEPALVPRPYLPDRVVRGPYVELFIPYEPRRHPAALRAACPTAAALAQGDAPGDARPALDCLRSILDVRLDGEPVEVPLDASSDPQGGRGLLAMIPADALAPGRHELTVRRPPRANHEDAGPPPPWRIPFWR